MHKTHTARLLSLAVLSLAAASAAPAKFEVVSSAENANVMTVESETAVENFTGRTNKISGTLTFDPVARTGSGTVIIDGASIDTGIAARNGHMRSPAWLNFDKVPQVKFTATRVTRLSGDQYRVTGNLTLNGVTRPVTADATVRYTPAGDSTKAAGLKGNVLAVSTKFNVKLSDFGVKNGQITSGRVNDELAISVRFIASDG
ncbi:hypothetical protein DAERI_110154 [Deinococcus aerius]|uniref:Lipid/polyisoprenoid-binding YceI-like domain-containing protein n=1 Tax=Deinococcus aerius TaxID=200253 RepID=A0A2I9CXY1_9DEIO|nr:YceI family protein [Deinococcus aerius]GBF06972.1 hypothetical protein DAERI_110154 [Deinococcus aerius]